MNDLSIVIDNIKACVIKGFEYGENIKIIERVIRVPVSMLQVKKIPFSIKLYREYGHYVLEFYMELRYFDMELGYMDFISDKHKFYKNEMKDLSLSVEIILDKFFCILKKRFCEGDKNG